MNKKDQAGNKYSRRAFMGGLGACAGLAAVHGGRWLGDDVSNYSFQDLFTVFEESLSAQQRELTFLPIDAPIRQVTLAEVVQKSPHIGSLYNNHQANLIRHMYQQMLSPQGRSWMQNTINFEGRFEGATFKIYSENIHSVSAQNSQVVINGGHFMLRSNNHRERAYALGGPISYGQQVGNNKYRVDGNAYKAHGDALDQFHRALSQQEKLFAYQVSPPNELLLQIQGVEGNFPGVRIGDVSDKAQIIAYEMLSTLFEGFTADQQSEAWSAVNENGGIESLHVAMYTDFGFYEDGSRYSSLSSEQQSKRGLPYLQVWRIEGPTFVIHFQGYPHVHAYMNIVRDPTKIAIGEALTEIKSPLGQDSTQQLIVSMLKQHTNATLAFYPELILGRLSPGIVSTGSIYTLDPYANQIIIADISTENMSQELINSLVKQGVRPDAGKQYRIATIGYMLKREDIFGAVDDTRYGFGTVRDTLIEFVRDKDLSSYHV